MKQFDDKFNDHVKNLFEDYNTNYNPKAWNKVASGLQPNKKKRFIIWFKYGIAASVLLIGATFGMTVLVKNHNNISAEKNESFNKKSVNSYRSENYYRSESVAHENHVKEENKGKKTFYKNSKLKNSRNSVFQNSNDLNFALKNSSLFVSNDDSNFLKNETNNNNANLLITKNDSSVEFNLFPPKFNRMDLVVVKSEDFHSGFIVELQKPEYFEDEEGFNAVYVKEFNSGVNVLNVNALSLNESEKAQKQNIKLGMLVAPSFNYSEGSNTSAGINAGILSEIPLSKRKHGILKNFKLYTGLLLAKQNVNFDETSVYSSGRTLSFVEENSLQSADKPLGIGILDKSSGSFVDSNVSASLLGLDIPINLKFNLNSKSKTKSYLVAGLSSVFYLNESYSYSRTEIYATNGNTDYATAEFNANSSESASTFDLARQLNFGFGFERKISNKTYLLIEPFYKHPLGGLTAEKLKYGTGGVSLRINFDVK